MAEPAVAARGEAILQIGDAQLALRPTFAALAAAEEDLGSLFALVGRAADGQLLFTEITTLFWHLLRDRPEHLTRAEFDEAMAGLGIARMTPVLKILLRQILQGQPAQAGSLHG
ncbi:MAG: GTA-gp10 family protein [Pseudomonadota bacterium]